ncbi:ATP-binding cassette domain-containing protein [Salinibacterium sp. NSLL150]|uniref:ABC transporter ATP-binding protein n=1 Tax=unclassified Salinibacterium TaxID=2632331 RepID=UPI0018CE8033|nr:MULTISPECIES: ATP-binding cassette domain-containing protein [unclassified Salinibacterium]MBH0099497.1 ATP-binding cassette domain-containing protein [Salinibacterium sp. NSLL35]MBH0102251.1 ATP-binding cassette domain-containing protein [Salinibacterium sp. NSLL150]MBH0105011.1 ATP-binding cassette domain-containing protein [Salinibacterium sp. NSLL16]MBH0107771.1 ATP-binding cassette domain-containing protein [Salinibacterium sp. NSLL17]MBH0110524.1 ATP-binding cassette domain-containing
MGKSQDTAVVAGADGSFGIRVDSLAVRIDDVPLLESVSFDISPGTAAAIIGANGAGKTTLLRVLAGLIAPTTGSAHVGELPADERSPAFRRMVAGHIGHTSFARDLTLDEQLTMVGVSWGAEVPVARERAAVLLDDFGLTRLRTRFAHELSSGQTQMFSLALAIARPFDVLLLDEPEQRLDKERRSQVARILRGLVAEGTTLLFASHNAKLIDAVSGSTVALTRS